MKKVLILALLAVVCVAMPAAASVQNIKISGDIESLWLTRHQFDLGATPGSQYEQNLLITQTRLRSDADLTDNVSATIALINERAWGTDGTSDTTQNYNDIDLNLAYVTLREMLYSPLTVVAGRQQFAFGNSFVIDSNGQNNNTDNGGLNGVAEDLTKATALDAVRLILDYNPLTLDIIYAKADSNNNAARQTSGTGHDDDVDLYGINANYQLGDSMETVVEAYFWAKLDQSVKDTGGQGLKADSIYMPGVRASSNVLEGLNLQTELAWQLGNDATVGAVRDNVKRRAIAAQVMSSYALPFESIKEYSPVVHASYSFASGDANPTETTRVGGDGHDTQRAWDPMYENQGGGTIVNTLLTFSNLHVVNIGTKVVPIEDIALTFDWIGVWLNHEIRDIVTPDNGLATSTVLQPDGSVVTLNVNDDKGLANEFGFGLWYNYTEDVTFGTTYNFLVPGSALTAANEKTATQFLLTSKVVF